MTLRVRRILSLIFILLFLIITPAIVLYAAGFKINLNDFSIQKTGMFIINSKPRGAKIFLNGKAQKTLINSIFNTNNFITTPVKIKNLLPGEYDLSLELNGYWSWQKKLAIEPKASTFAEDIYLFKNSPPIQIMPAEIQSINLSPNKNPALILSADQIIFFNLSDETKQFTSPSNLKERNIAWSGDGQKFLVGNYLYDLNNLNINFDLSKTSGGFNYKWQGDILYFQDKTSIYQLNNKNLPKKIISSSQFNDYLIKAGILYLIKPAEQTANLEIIDLTTNNPVKIISLPSATNYSFINSEHALLNLYDNNHKILYLINPLADYYSPLTEIINNVKTASWISDNNLLYVNDFEIWLYNLETRNKTLITRISQTINRAIMHPNRNYIIYSTDQTINAIELDERNKRNITELIKFDLINSFVLNARGNLLYFSGKIGQAEGLYKLLIQ